MQSISEELTAALDRFTRVVVGESEEPSGLQRTTAAQKRFDEANLTWGHYTHGLEADEIEEFVADEAVRGVFEVFATKKEGDGTPMATPRDNLRSAREFRLD